MSLFSGNPAIQVDEERNILLVIFDHLDVEDLLRCETVCRQWRNVLLSGETWTRLFDRLMVSSSQWRQFRRNFVPDENKLQTEHYKSLCRAIVQEQKQVDRNWRTGNFKKTSENVDSFDFAQVVIGYDYIALENYSRPEDYYGFEGYERPRNRIRFLHRSSLNMKSCIFIPDGWSATTNAEIAVLWDEKDMKILDSDGQLISEVAELNENERISWKLVSCCISGDQLAVLSRTEGQAKLSLWDVRNPPNVICLKSRWFNLNLQLGHSTSMKMDDQFIAVFSFLRLSRTVRHQSASFYFFSKETLNLHWQMDDKQINECNFVYDKGTLLLCVISFYRSESKEDNVIKMYDVKSGQCFREMPIAALRLKDSVCYNSKFMIVATDSFKLKIYDLEDVKNPKSAANELSVHDMRTELDFSSLSVDETEIFITCDNGVQRLNFGSFDCFRNATNSVTLSSPWRSVWRSKGVVEEPLKPARHMEVYKKVLKYFNELCMDCQTAIKKYPIRDVNVENFTLGDDFIGYRPKMVIYDENMCRRPQEIIYKTVQISKSTHVSLMGKTIQLINSSTCNVVKEFRLNRDAINLHFNCNLLVCVCKIGENEHLLSVWRVENSFNLTHVKDVTVWAYDGSLQVDEQFIAVKIGKRESIEKTFNFISMKTFQVERTVSSRAEYLQYDGGCLFELKKPNLVGVLDVASGTFLRDIRIKPSTNYHMIFRVNSNYVVMNNLDSKLYVYDLKCLKETAAVPSHLLLTTIDLGCPVKEMLMNETRIVCLSDKNMFVVDLQPIDRLRCPDFVNWMLYSETD